MYWSKINGYDGGVTARVTPVPAGAAGARYPWECKGHEHDRQSYYIDGAESGPVARWLGDGVERFGFQAGESVDKEPYMIMYGELMDPVKHAALTAQAEAEIAELGLKGDEAKAHYAELLEGARLGRAPRQFKSVEERLAERLKAEPDADEARQADLRREVEATQRQAVGSFDITFSPQKSISLYRAGLLAQGRGEDAAKVEGAHRAGVEAALAYVQREAGFARVGYHGKAAGSDMPSVGRYVDAHQWTGAEFLHETSRAGDVQMHSHLMVLNRVEVTDPETGATKWVTLDSRALHKARKAAEAVYHRTMEEQLVRDLPVELATREDGKAREIIGITVEDREAASSRRQQVKGELEKYVELYRERTGHDPSPRTLSKMAETATLKTRDRKDPSVSMDELIDRWERQAVAHDRRTHAEMVDSAEEAAVGRRLERLYEETAPELDRAEVIRAALAEVQAERAHFAREDVMRSIARALPEQLGEAATNAGGVAALLDSLADEALTGANDVIQVVGFEMVETPAELRRESDGRSVYQPGRSERYSTLAQLTAEEKLVATASRTDAPRLTPEQIEAAIEASTLGEDQAAAVRGVLGDGRQVSTIVGPAGTGKSYAQGVITKAWEQSGTGRVIGLAPSNVAAAVLAEAGITDTTNLDRFLLLNDGKGRVEDQERFTVRAGDLIIVDEAAMANHSQMTQLIQIAAEAGAKMATVGDEAQMQSVGAGGGFRLIRQEVGAYELTTVRRFRDADGNLRRWEADASLKLRDGDTAALAAYEEHGRLYGGTEQEMTEAAVEAYVADVVDGRQAVLVTPTNEVADDLSARIRAELVRLGRVEEGGAAVMGGNVAGVGDLIQTRENEPTLVDSAGLPVINRRMYKVRELHEDGSLTVQHLAGRDKGSDVWGGTVRLNPEYVASQVALGYAGTVMAAQGRTVDRGYLYGDEQVYREAAYVALTRGWELNTAFMVTQRQPEDPDLRTLDSTVIGQLARVLERESTDRSAVEMLRAGLDHAESLPALAPMWVDVTARHTRTQAREMLTTMLGADAAARLDAEHADPLYRHLRERELQGHDIEALLRDAIGDPQSVTDARELGALLQYRVEQAADRRTPEREPVGPDWRDRTPADLDGAVGEFAREVAEKMQARQEQLGRQVAEQAPEWAVERLGEVPQSEPDRAAWEERAAVVAAYRELYDVDGAGAVIGQAPPRGAVEQRAAWEAAYEALGRLDEHRHIAEASDEQLRQMIDTYQREQQWAPSYVGDRMAEAHQNAREYERRAALAEAEARTLADEAQRVELEQRAAGYRELAAGYDEQARTYEEIHEARQLWQADTEPVRESAQAAAAELERRHVDQQPGRQGNDGAVVLVHEPVEWADTGVLDWSDVEADRVPERDMWEPERDAEPELEFTAPGAVEARRAELADVELDWSDVEADRTPDEEIVQEHDVERVQDVAAQRGDAEPTREAEPDRRPERELGDGNREQGDGERQGDTERATPAVEPQAPTLQDELRAARAYLERRVERQAAAQQEVAATTAQREAAQEEQVRAESARLMRERQAEQELSRGIER